MAGVRCLSRRNTSENSFHSLTPSRKNGEKRKLSESTTTLVNVEVEYEETFTQSVNGTRISSHNWHAVSTAFGCAARAKSSAPITMDDLLDLVTWRDNEPEFDPHEGASDEEEGSDDEFEAFCARLRKTQAEKTAIPSTSTAPTARPITFSQIESEPTAASSMQSHNSVSSLRFNSLLRLDSRKKATKKPSLRSQRSSLDEEENLEQAFQGIVNDDNSCETVYTTSSGYETLPASPSARSQSPDNFWDDVDF